MCGSYSPRPVRTLLLPALIGCSTVHGVRPLGDNVVAIEISEGGPVTEVFGGPVPIPLTTVGAAYGIDDLTDVHAAVHPTTIALFGLGAFDVGASRQLLAPKGLRPRLMADLTVVSVFGDTDPKLDNGAFGLFAQPTLTASWDWAKDGRHALYTGLTAMVQTLPERRVVGAVAVGNLWALSPKTHLATEVKWIAPYASSLSVVPDYYTPQGALSLQFGLQARFGGKAP